jgi:hypothetical protein
MSANELAIKFSTAPAEMMIGILPVEEIADVIRGSVRDEVEREVDDEYSIRLQAVEDDASDWESKAEEYECDATDFARAIEKAVLCDSLEEVKILLERVKSDHREYF